MSDKFYIIWVRPQTILLERTFDDKAEGLRALAALREAHGVKCSLVDETLLREKGLSPTSDPHSLKYVIPPAPPPPEPEPEEEDDEDEEE